MADLPVRGLRAQIAISILVDITFFRDYNTCTHALFPTVSQTVIILVSIFGVILLIVITLIIFGIGFWMRLRKNQKKITFSKYSKLTSEIWYMIREGSPLKVV
jgi:site-specific recombinase